MQLPVLAGESSFQRYLQEIRKFPSLSAEDEYMHACKYRDFHDLKSAHVLITSHLKLVVKMALDYRGYGLPVIDMISEGNIGLMQAVKKFNPDLGFRLSTYAMWWIRAAIQEFVLKSWSLVKLGTTTAQKKLFFNLRKIQRKIYSLEARNLTDEDVRKIARDLDVTVDEVEEMNQRMLGQDLSLNRMVGDSDNKVEMIELIPDNRSSQELILIEQDEKRRKRELFYQALSSLNEREQQILKARRLQEVPSTLDELSKEYNISLERVRQIEARAYDKLLNAVKVNISSS